MLIDISHTINNNCPTLPEDPDCKITQIANHKINKYSLHQINTGTHTATHIDAPNHFLKDGKKINQIPLTDVHGPAKILETQTKIKNTAIQPQNLKPYNTTPTPIIIIKTGWHTQWNTTHYFTQTPYLSEKLTQQIIQQKEIKGIAIDTPTVDKPGETKIHKKLLSNNIWIAENITNLKQLKNNQIYQAYFIPLKINTEAAPIRAFIKQKKIE